MHKSVLLDTSFFIRFLDETDPLYKNADGYFRYFLENNIKMVISTISIGEYCVLGAIDEIPTKALQILPFNIIHAQRTGVFAKSVFSNKGILNLSNRNIIPNDTKLFAQADCEIPIDFYLSSDTESKKIYDFLKKQPNPPKFQFIDINIPHYETFGLLGL